MSEPNATFCLLVPDLTTLSDEEKDALIVKLWSETVALRLEVEHLRNLNTALERRLSELENKLNQRNCSTPLLKSPSEHRGQGHSSSFEAFILTRIVARFQTRSLESSGHRRFSLL